MRFKKKEAGIRKIEAGILRNLSKLNSRSSPSAPGTWKSFISQDLLSTQMLWFAEVMVYCVTDSLFENLLQLLARLRLDIDGQEKEFQILRKEVPQNFLCRYVNFNSIKHKY